MCENAIQNENEFYSPHYWSTLFKDSVKRDIKTLKENSELKDTSVVDGLKLLGKKYQDLKYNYKNNEDQVERVQIFREFSYELLACLGYDRDPQPGILEDETWIPCLYQAKFENKIPKLWIVESLSPFGEDFETDPLLLEHSKFLNEIYSQDSSNSLVGAYGTAITNGIFGLDYPPRFVLLISMAQVILIDRNKWHGSSLLSF